MEQQGQPKKKMIIKEISHDSAERVLCPFCYKNLPISIEKDFHCKGVTTYCKHCRRKLSLDAPDTS